MGDGVRWNEMEGEERGPTPTVVMKIAKYVNPTLSRLMVMSKEYPMTLMVREMTMCMPRSWKWSEEIVDAIRNNAATRDGATVY
jgi:hypothetical protein